MKKRLKESAQEEAKKKKKGNYGPKVYNREY